MLIDNPSDFFLSVAACPISKESLRLDEGTFRAPCGLCYPGGDFRVGLDFSNDWSKAQQDYESWQARTMTAHEQEEGFYAAVDSEVEDVYQALPIRGAVLDVGGNFGTLAKQVALDIDTYVAVDPIVILWNDYARFARFQAHYRMCAGVCRVPAFAEFLPIRSGTMDVVHMRSCLDHFANPALALKEAYRVLKVGGSVIVGLSLEGAYKKTARGVIANVKLAGKKVAPIRKVYEHFFDHHAFHPTHDGVTSLLKGAGFTIEKEVWQAAYYNVLYVLATKAA